MQASDGGIYSIVPYGSFTAYTPTLPQFYWDVYSAEQRVKHICYELDKIIAYANYLGTNVNSVVKDYEKLKEELDNLQESGFYDIIEKQITAWINDNLLLMWKTFSLGVFFGLTDDGYFCAYVPESWSDIMFDTGAVYGRSDYGRLILRVDVDGSGVIDNSYGYTLNSGDAAQIRGDLEMAMKTLFSDLTETIEYQGAN